MRIQFRHRIGLLVALAAVAMLVVTAVTLVLGRRSEQQLAGIETRYVPLLELDRDLQRLSAEVTRALEDAAGAGEEAKLDEADRLSAELLHRLRGGEAAIVDNGSDPRAVADAFRAYYALARAVSAELVAGTPAVELSERIEAMRRAHRDFAPQLDAAARPDRARLAEAFAAARASQDASLTIDILVAATVLAVMALLSWRMIRRVVGSLGAVSAGVERLARGEFGIDIEVPPGDEIHDLAREANRTARRLREYREQIEREQQRTQELLLEAQRAARAAETANKELEAFSYSVSHDLRAPLRTIDGFSQALVEDERDKLSPEARQYLDWIREGAQRMGELIDDLLRLSRVSRGQLEPKRVDLSAIAEDVIAELRRAHPDRSVEVVIAPGLVAHADAALIKIALENLLGNAWKFTGKAAAPRIELGAEAGTKRVFFVRDNGAGFDMQYAPKLFGAFQRLHGEQEFPGTGIGLATVNRIVLRHGGRIWVEAAVGKGATFSFTLPDDAGRE